MRLVLVEALVDGFESHQDIELWKCYAAGPEGPDSILQGVKDGGNFVFKLCTKAHSSAISSVSSSASFSDHHSLCEGQDSPPGRSTETAGL